MNKRFPSPFQLAIYLSFFSFILVGVVQFSEIQQTPLKLITWWGNGIWSLLAFTMQMMLMLLLGSMLAKSPFVHKGIHAFVQALQKKWQAYFFLTLFSLILGLINWGLGLVLSAILAKEVYLIFKQRNQNLNYGLLAASAYTCMMVWHAGFSGSAPLTIASDQHFLFEKIGQVTVDVTIFSARNLIWILSSLIIIPIISVLVGRRTSSELVYELSDPKPINKKHQAEWKFLALGGIILIYAIIQLTESGGLSGLNLNLVNAILFAAAILALRNSTYFLKVGEETVSSTFGILIQFPLYAGIMGLLTESGTISELSTALSEAATSDTLPYLSFVSAAILNCLVPSGGGQWAVQGPIICDAVIQQSADLPRSIMAFCYGDQLTNMIQPFWALPLLAITQVRIKDLLPYCLLFFFVGLILTLLIV